MERNAVRPELRQPELCLHPPQLVLVGRNAAGLADPDTHIPALLLGPQVFMGDRLRGASFNRMRLHGLIRQRVYGLHRLELCQFG